MMSEPIHKKGFTRSVGLREGEITLSVSQNIEDLDRRERQVVMTMLDLMDQYIEDCDEGSKRKIGFYDR